MEWLFIIYIVVFLAAVYKRSTTSRWTPPKPQPRRLAWLAALLGRSFHSLPAVLVSPSVVLAAAPLGPTRPQPHCTSHLPNLVAGAVGASDSLARATRALGALVGTRHRRRFI